MDAEVNAAQSVFYNHLPQAASKLAAMSWSHCTFVVLSAALEQGITTVEFIGDKIKSVKQVIGRSVSDVHAVEEPRYVQSGCPERSVS